MPSSDDAAQPAVGIMIRINTAAANLRIRTTSDLREGRSTTLDLEG
jgi:hypothetical protein